MKYPFFYLLILIKTLPKKHHKNPFGFLLTITYTYEYIIDS